MNTLILCAEVGDRCMSDHYNDTGMLGLAFKINHFTAESKDEDMQTDSTCSSKEGTSVGTGPSTSGGTSSDWSSSAEVLGMSNMVSHSSEQ